MKAASKDRSLGPLPAVAPDRGTIGTMSDSRPPRQFARFAGLMAGDCTETMQPNHCEWCSGSVSYCAYDGQKRWRRRAHRASPSNPDATWRTGRSVWNDTSGTGYRKDPPGSHPGRDVPGGKPSIRCHHAIAGPGNEVRRHDVESAETKRSWECICRRTCRGRLWRTSRDHDRSWCDGNPSNDRCDWHLGGRLRPRRTNRLGRKMRRVARPTALRSQCARQNLSMRTGQVARRGIRLPIRSIESRRAMSEPEQNQKRPNT